MSWKRFLLVTISVLLLMPFSAQSSNIFAPPMPARIGGTVTVDGTQLTQATDAGYTFKVTELDGTDYVDLNGAPAQDLDGLNASDWYLIDIPIYDATDQPGGANPGDTAVIRVYKDGSELSVTCPANGEFTVGDSGSTAQIDLTDTPPGTLQFSAATYSVDEGGTTAIITVTRTGGSNGGASVDYATSDGTATEGDDYTAASDTLNWADGDANSKTFTVSITDDLVVEDNEIVNLTLSNPTGCAEARSSRHGHLDH